MRSFRYVRWLDRHRKAVLLTAALVVGVAGYLAVARLPVRSDFSYLLPPDAPAVRDAERLAAQLPAQDVMIALVVAPDEATREAVTTELADRIGKLPRDLIVEVEASDRELRELVRSHQYLYTPVGDLEAARTALTQRITEAKLRANPVYIDLTDEPSRATSARGGPLDQLRDKLRAAEAKLARDSHVSGDGKTSVIVVRTAFRGTDVTRDRRLMSALSQFASELSRDHPTVQIGYAGGPAVTVAEHAALTRGMMMSSAITLVLVMVVLWLHLRSARILGVVTVNLLAGTVAAFGLAAITVGQLNAATAFLGAIIAGNGVNYGVLLAARYREERRQLAAVEALARAFAATLKPTLVASLGAAVAYGALLATEFRGFADFAIIGGLGMLVLWVASFTLLPTLILQFATADNVASHHASWFGRAVARVFVVRRPAVVAVVASIIVLASSAIAWRYITGDPYEYDLAALRSQAPDALAHRAWLRRADDTFGRGLAGLGGQTFLAVDHERDVDSVVDQLKAIAARDPIVGPLRSIRDVMPTDQPRKLALLADLRRLIDEAAPLLDDDERSELLAHRPPDQLAALTYEQLPERLRAPELRRMVAVRPGDIFDETDGHDLIHFAAAVRQIAVDGERPAISSPGLMFADILDQVRTDGPRITGFALLGVVLVVVFVVGRSRRSIAVLTATATGTIVMVATCAVVGLKVSFLDFVALPITLGLGVDYAINLADRALESNPSAALRSTGGTVLVCSLTTIIGYGSLLVSDNGAICGFGLASLIGEVTCVLAAFVIVPAILGLPALAAGRQPTTLTPA